MNLFSTLQRLAAIAFFVFAATASSALTLGRSQGVALIGRPLDISVQLTLDTGSEAAALCLEADVFYGDTRLAASRVDTRLEAVSVANGTVRVSSPVTVDEPIVTVYLRVGCSQKISRRYVMLAEPDAFAEPAAPPAPAAMAPPVASPSTAATDQAGVQAGAARARPAMDRPAKAVAPAVAVQAPERGTQAAGKAARPSGTVGNGLSPRGGARLQLDSLDLAMEREGGLKLSTTLGSVPEASPQRRAEAAALWLALNAAPEDMLRESLRLQRLETESQGLREVSQASDAGLLELRSQLERARGQRYSWGLLSALLTLALVAASAAVLQGWRRGRLRLRPGGDWWRAGAGAAAARERDFNDATSPSRRGSAQLADIESGPMDLDLNFTESGLDSQQARAVVVKSQVGRQAPRRSAASDFQTSRSESLRSVKAEELHDVQQQADFFVSLGKYPQAIEVLLDHINVQPETSPLPWLDLLEIYHSLKRQSDYEGVRDEFHRVFNAHVPSFETYHEHDGGLETYDVALSRIVALWPAPKVLEVIEETIFRKPGQDGSEAFSLEAYRELLLLHAIGLEVIGNDRGGVGVGIATGAGLELTGNSRSADFSHTAMHPLSVGRPVAVADRFDSDATLPGFTPIGLDIDLDDAAGTALKSFAFNDEDSVNGAASVYSNLLDFDLPDAPPPGLSPKESH